MPCGFLPFQAVKGWDGEEKEYSTIHAPLVPLLLLLSLLPSPSLLAPPSPLIAREALEAE